MSCAFTAAAAARSRSRSRSFSRSSSSCTAQHSTAPHHSAAERCQNRGSAHEHSQTPLQARCHWGVPWHLGLFPRMTDSEPIAHGAGDGCARTGCVWAGQDPCAWRLLPAGPSMAAAGHTVVMRLQPPSSSAPYLAAPALQLPVLLEVQCAQVPRQAGCWRRSLHSLQAVSDVAVHVVCVVVVLVQLKGLQARARPGG